MSFCHILRIRIQSSRKSPTELCVHFKTTMVAYLFWTAPTYIKGWGRKNLEFAVQGTYVEILDLPIDKYSKIPAFHMCKNEDNNSYFMR